jgi:hypothetical protein
MPPELQPQRVLNKARVSIAGKAQLAGCDKRQ